MSIRPAAISTLCVAIVLLVSACSPSSSPSSSPASAPDDPPPTPAPSASAPDDAPAATAPPTAAGEPDLDAVTLVLEPIVDLAAPTAMATRPGDDALYVAERAGRVVRVADGRVAGEPVADISAQTTEDSERGLLGLTFSPDGDRLYLSFTNTAGDSQLDEYEMRGNAVDRSTRRDLLLVEQPFSNHNGGNVVTGPDGLLYYGLGDGGAGFDPAGNGQNTATLLGGLLRIDPTPSGDAPYTVPADNPFAGAGDARGELWIYGLRNPWRFSFDRENDDLWIADVGQREIEEINRLPFDRAAGANLGWSIFEGTQRISDGSADAAVAPVFEYPHDGRCSVTGGYVYRGQQIPALRGAYVFGDFCDGVVRALVPDGATATDARAFDLRVPGLVSFGEDADGELYTLSLEGTVSRLTGS